MVLVPFRSNFPKFVKLNLILIGHKSETRLHHNEANYGRYVLSVLINNSRKTEPLEQRFLTLLALWTPKFKKYVPQNPEEVLDGTDMFQVCY